MRRTCVLLAAVVLAAVVGAGSGAGAAEPVVDLTLRGAAHGFLIDYSAPNGQDCPRAATLSAGEDTGVAVGTLDGQQFTGRGVFGLNGVDRPCPYYSSRIFVYAGRLSSLPNQGNVRAECDVATPTLTDATYVLDTGCWLDIYTPTSGNQTRWAALHMELTLGPAAPVDGHRVGVYVITIKA